MRGKSHYVTSAGFELLNSSNPLSSAPQVREHSTHSVPRSHTLNTSITNKASLPASSDSFISQLILSENMGEEEGCCRLQANSIPHNIGVHAVFFWVNKLISLPSAALKESLCMEHRIIQPASFQAEDWDGHAADLHMPLQSPHTLSVTQFLGPH